MAHPQILEAVDPAALAGFDDIIDVRSPAEFAADRVPGAINLPVLDDAQRAEVGTIYVQESAFRARRMGAALVARNIAHHLETTLVDRPAGYKPLIYCWRGGQRSNAMATILGQIGWRPSVLSGGYRTYRRWIQGKLYGEPVGLNLILLDGGTGVGKTDVLHALASMDVQTLDLEGLAEHRGSLFGGRKGCRQPSQKMFESRLMSVLDGLDPARPVVAEAESHKIGECMIPPALWTVMSAAPRIVLTAPRTERARYLVERYPDIAADRDTLRATIARLPVHIGRKSVETLHALAEAGNFVALADALMETHYDPAYARSTAKENRVVLAHIALDELDRAATYQAADTIAVLVHSAVTSTA